MSDLYEFFKSIITFVIFDYIKNSVYRSDV